VLHSSNNCRNCYLPPLLPYHTHHHRHHHHRFHRVVTYHYSHQLVPRFSCNNMAQHGMERNGRHSEFGAMEFPRREGLTPCCGDPCAWLGLRHLPFPRHLPAILACPCYCCSRHLRCRQGCCYGAHLSLAASERASKSKNARCWQLREEGRGAGRREALVTCICRPG